MNRKLDKDFWKEFEDTGTIIEIERPDFNKIVDNCFVKQLRTRLDLTQKVFSDVLGVTKKTVEKWEQGANPVKGPTARLLYLIDSDLGVVNRLHRTDIIRTFDEKNDRGRYTIKETTPLVSTAKTEVTEFSTQTDDYEEMFDRSDFRIEGGRQWQKKSSFQPLSS